MTTIELLESQLAGARYVKAFNNMLAVHLPLVESSHPGDIAERAF